MLTRLKVIMRISSYTAKKMIFCIANIKRKEKRYRLNLMRDVVSENKEMITRPAITLIPSIFSLFSLPLFTASFSLGCRSIENSPIRYLLIVFYLISFIPQIITFFSTFIHHHSTLMNGV